MSNKSTKNSGSELLEVQTDWRESEGDAVSEANDLIENLISDTRSELESDGKKVIGTYNYPILTQEKNENGRLFHMASTKAEINWVYENEIISTFSNTDIENKEHKNNYLIVEDELLKRFKKKFTGRYDRIGLSKLDFIDSDIIVDFTDFIEIPKSS